MSAIEWVIDQLDYVLIMTVNPGFGGQSFIQATLEKIQELSQLLQKAGSKAIIQVDGGINPDTIGQVSKAGATCFVAGSAIFHTEDYARTIALLRKNAVKGK